MDTPKIFLVVDDNADSRFLLVKTLLRKFPSAIIRECQECVDAVKIAQLDTLAAVVAHRAADMDGISLVRELRAANPHVIIVMVSGLDRTESAIRAGATCFLNYDEWLRVGSLVTELLSRAAKPSVASGLGDRQSGSPEADRPGISRSSSTPAANE